MAQSKCDNLPDCNVFEGEFDRLKNFINIAGTIFRPCFD